MKYPDLVFDLYGTLVDIHTEETDSVWEQTAIYFGFYGARYTGAELKSAFERIMTLREAKAGQSYECFPDIPFEQVMTQLFLEKGITENADSLSINAAQLFRILSIEYIKLYPHVLEALAYLREKGHRLWLLSNAQQVFTAYELRLLGLGEQLLLFANQAIDDLRLVDRNGLRHTGSQHLLIALDVDILTLP